MFKLIFLCFTTVIVTALASPFVTFERIPSAYVNQNYGYYAPPPQQYQPILSKDVIISFSRPQFAVPATSATSESDSSEQKSTTTTTTTTTTPRPTTTSSIDSNSASLSNRNNNSGAGCNLISCNQNVFRVFGFRKRFFLPRFSFRIIPSTVVFNNHLPAPQAIVPPPQNLGPPPALVFSKSFSIG